MSWYWQAPLTVLALALALCACGHAMLHKRDPRAAWGWITVSLLLPFVGVLLYLLLGINRVETRARRLRPRLARVRIDSANTRRRRGQAALPAALQPLIRTGDALTGRPLLDGNAVTLLFNGEEAYPRMLAAIEEARASVLLATYIFDVDETGERFIDALVRAHRRGVAVRVIVDGYAELIGSRPRASRRLSRLGIPVARFHPPRLIPPSLHINLRSHRKLLIVDGEVGYTGGMNISDRHLAEKEPRDRRETDIHCELRGPIVRQLLRSFADDWSYCAAGACPGTDGLAEGHARGEAVCRVITDGPNEDLGQLTLILFTAMACAERHVRIMTPYFLPPREIVAAMEAAVMRGVTVEVFLPSYSDLPRVHAAMHKMLTEMIRRGIRVYWQPPPFAHAKLLVVDGQYVQVGSANIDTRSLRLNFELVAEIFDPAFAQGVEQHFDTVRALSRLQPLEELLQRPLRQRLRSAFWWLLSPYL